MTLDVVFVGTKPREEKFQPVLMDPSFPHKPRGGLWTCRGMEWAEWSVANFDGLLRRSPHHRGLWKLTAREPKLLTISSTADVRSAAELYPYNWRQAVGLLPSRLRCPSPELNHEAIAAAGYDGVEVTRVNFWFDELTEGDPIDYHLAASFSSWDVPTILWYRWAFEGPPQSLGRIPALKRDNR